MRPMNNECNETTYFSPAKINWFLHITGQRSDGYHLLETVFQRIDWCDELCITPRFDGLIRLTGDLSGVPEEKNLAHRAAVTLKVFANDPLLGADIFLKKNIPTGAGLGGGSSNAATVLTALNQLWQLDLPSEQLQKMGLTLGADVPFFVSGYHAAYARGVGEVLQPLDLPVRDVLLVNPNVHVATAAVFSHPDLPRSHPPVNLSLDALAQKLQLNSDDFLTNDLEKSTFAMSEEVAEVHRTLREHAPNTWVRMSGSGATVFAAPLDESERRALCDWQLNQTSLSWQTRWVNAI